MKRNNSKKIFENASHILSVSQHAELLANYLDTVMKDRRRDPYAVDFFIKNGGLSNVYENIANIQDELREISDQLTVISEEEKGDGDEA